MNDDAPRVESDADVVDTRCADLAGELANVTSLGSVDGVDGVVAAGHGADFDDDPLRLIGHQQVDLTSVDLQIRGDNVQPLLGQPPGRESLSDGAQEGAAFAQSLSSVFSSFSTFTSRKVRTWTCSRNLAGRNMSQTQASFITTSK